jgi:hypothetical protein
MYSHERIIQLYQDLAEAYGRRHDPGMREDFLLLAADAALEAGQGERAEQFRHVLLRENPSHEVRYHASFAEAARHPDTRARLDDLRQQYPPEKAEHLLEELEESFWPAHASPPPGVPSTTPPQPRGRGQPVTEESSALDPLKIYPPSVDVAQTQPPPVPLPRPAARPAVPPQRPAAGQPRPATPPSANQLPTETLPPPPPAVPRTVLPRQAAAAKPLAAPRPAANPPPPAPPPPPRPVPRPQAPPPVVEQRSPALRRPAGPARFSQPKEHEEEPMAGGAWFSTLLFLLLLLAGLSLAFIALVPPELFQQLTQGA